MISCRTLKSDTQCPIKIFSLNMCKPAKDKEINQKIIMMPHIEKLSPLTHGSCSVQLIKYFHTSYKHTLIWHRQFLWRNRTRWRLTSHQTMLLTSVSNNRRKNQRWCIDVSFFLPININIKFFQSFTAIITEKKTHATEKLDISVS